MKKKVRLLGAAAQTKGARDIYRLLGCVKNREDIFRERENIYLVTHEKSQRAMIYYICKASGEIWLVTKDYIFHVENAF